jgi:predicted oxidoreductase
MKTYRIANTPFEATRIAYGCMGISGAWSPEPLTDQTRKNALASVRAALDAGMNFFDHADIYAKGKCEEAFSGIWKEMPGLREKVIIQTKCGIRFENDPTQGVPGRYDFSKDHILSSVEGSLRRLKTDYVDILLLHRPDALVEPDEVAAAFEQLYVSGKVRYFGVSNHSAGQIELLKRSVTHPFVVNQLELNVVHSQLIYAGVVVNQDAPATPVHGEGTLEYCRLNNITIQAWSPVAHGKIAKSLAGQGDERMRAAGELATSLAKKKGVSMDAILLAWLLRHPAGIQPILGTTQPERIREACKADDVELTREEWYALLAAGRGSKVA